jgi:ATP-dependent DNA helicase RecG
MPAGRSKIITKLVNAGESDSLWKFVRQQLANGKQAYIVCPRVESDPASEIKAVKTEYVRIKKLLAPFEVALVHGEIPREEREKIMDAFRSGAVSVLVATTVIEVGVDVPNATVMVIENAERFGLAQLHQLRGRIGRGVAESYCFLVASPRKLDKAAYDALKRLNVLVQTSNGFEIAEADLQMRGPGELLGQAQSGLPSLKFADFIKDFKLIAQAKEIARSIISKMNI